MALKFRNFMDFKKSMLVFKAAILTIAFIALGNLIAYETGITEQLSKIFYWPDKGLVAGEFEVRAADESGPDFNPPYPRIGQVTFYPAGTAGPDVWKNHDMLGYRSYDARPASTAQKIKIMNPDIILLGASGISHTEIESITKEKVPEEYFLHYADGSRQKFWGNYVMNLANEGPKVDYVYGNQNFNEFFAEFLVKNTAWDYYDGLLFDTWWHSPKWYGKSSDEIDFDYNSQADGGAVWSRWQRGKETLVSNIRVLKPNIVIIPHEGGDMFFNGNAFEFWSQQTFGSRVWNFNKAIELLSNAVEPRIVYANSQAGSYVEIDIYGRKWMENSYSGHTFRADFASSQIAGAFFGHDEGTYAHRWTFMHDEYEADLGYPTSGIESPSQRLYMKYFDNGLIIYYISSTKPTIVQASQLKGGPYYRFLGNQDPEWNNGQKVDDSHPIKFDYSYQYIDDDNTTHTVYLGGIMLFKQPTTLVTPIIIDNKKYNMTTVGQEPVEYVGSWEQVNKGPSAYALGVTWDKDYGQQYAISPSGTGESIATYRPKINVPGEYEIFEWHGSIEGQIQASNVPYEIYTGDQRVKSGTIDQTKNQGQWNSLGTFDLTQGENNYVKISNNASGYVISDAIRFVNLTSQTQNGSNRFLIPDFNCDNQVNIQDFGIMLSHWQNQDKSKLMNYTHPNCDGKTKPIEIAPMNNSCVLTSVNPIIDAVDIGMLLSCWGVPKDDGKTCCWAGIGGGGGNGGGGGENGGGGNGGNLCGNGQIDQNEICDGRVGIPQNSSCSNDCQSWHCSLGYELNNNRTACVPKTSSCTPNIINQYSANKILIPNPNAEPPVKGQSYCDPAFGTEITRITQKAGVNNNNKDLGGLLENSEDFNWNSDGTLFFAWAGNDGTHLFKADGTDLGNIHNLLPEWDIRWSREPNYVYKQSGGSRIEKCNVNTLQCDVLKRFSSGVRWGEEADFSDDRQRVSLEKTGTNVIFIYDVAADKVGAELNLGSGNIDYHTISAGGNYVIVGWKSAGASRNQGVEIYKVNSDLSLSFARQIQTSTAHFEVGYNPTGNEVVFMAADSSYNGKTDYNGKPMTTYDIVSIRLSDGQVTRLFDRVGNTADQVMAVPNWQTVHYDYLYVSDFDSDKSWCLCPQNGACPSLNCGNANNLADWQPYYYEIYEIPTDGSEKIRRLVHNRSLRLPDMPDKIPAQPDFSIDWSGSKILFKSTMNSRGTDLYMFDLMPRDGEGVGNGNGNGNSNDRSAPVVSNFNVESANSFRISWEVADGGGSGLKQVEIWRYPGSCGQAQNNWGSNLVDKDIISIANKSTFHSGSKIQSPANGKYCYGLHAVDWAGNVGFEPGPPGPIDKTENSFQSQPLENFVDNFIAVYPAGQLDRRNYWSWFEGVWLYGMWQAYEATGKTDYYNYIVDYFDRHLNSNGDFLPGNQDRHYAPHPADHVSQGISLIGLAQKTGNQRYKRAVNNLVEHILNEDKWKGIDMWANDERLKNGWKKDVILGGKSLRCIASYDLQIPTDFAFMDAIFLVKAGKFLNRPEVIQAGIDQMLCRTRALQASNGLFSHYYTYGGSVHPNNIYWGRGNGWMAASLADVLVDIGPNNQYYNELKLSLDKLLAGAAADQDNSSGNWYTVMDYNHNNNYIETSGSALFNYAFRKAVNNNLVSQDYSQVIEKSTNGLSSFIENKQLTNVSGGTGRSTDYGSYLSRPSNNSSLSTYAYGAGAYMLALAEDYSGQLSSNMLDLGQVRGAAVQAEGIKPLSLVQKLMLGFATLLILVVIGIGSWLVAKTLKHPKH